MKKIVYSFLLFCLIVMASPLTSMAEAQWDSPIEPVDSKKVWNITLSNTIDESTITNKVIYVLDEKGELQSTQAVWSESNPRVVEVYPPHDGYQEGHQYVLHISNSLKSISGVSLADNIRMGFSVQDNSVQKIVLGTWKTSYLGINLVATFNENYTSLVRLGEIEEKGVYKIVGEDMTMTVLGETRTGKVEKKTLNIFTITSPYGNIMKFER